MTLDPRAVYRHIAKMANGNVMPAEAKPRAKRFTGRTTMRKRERLAALVAVSGGTTCVIPIRTYSEANNRDHYMKKAARAKVQRSLTEMMVKRLDLPAFPVRVEMTRIGKRSLDGDNLSRSLKAVRDGIADAFGVDDGDERYEWVPMQEVGSEWGVRISIRAKGK